MKIFISWSGEKSNAVALALREFIEDVIQLVKPWMSEVDIEPGERWSEAIDRELKESAFGVICITPDNVKSPWLLFEAGALAKAVKTSKVVPYLFNMEPSQIPRGPLAKFQAKKVNEEHTFELFRSINNTLGEKKLSEQKIRKAFYKYWPDYWEKLEGLRDKGEKPEPKRTTEDMLKEILEIVRSLERSKPGSGHGFGLSFGPDFDSEEGGNTTSAIGGLAGYANKKKGGGLKGPFDDNK